MKRGIILGCIQIGLVLSAWAQFAWDRASLPRAWAPVVPVDPYAPIRGRYVLLRISAEMASTVTTGGARLEVRDNRLWAEPVTGGLAISPQGMLYQPVAFFISEKIADPSVRKEGEQLWVEVSVPKKGMPRPIRLAVKSADGAFTPLEIR